MAVRKHPSLSLFELASDDGRRVRNILYYNAWNNHTIGTVPPIVSLPEWKGYGRFVAVQHVSSRHGKPITDFGSLQSSEAVAPIRPSFL